jgi:hypothetical protein
MSGESKAGAMLTGAVHEREQVAPGSTDVTFGILQSPVRVESGAEAQSPPVHVAYNRSCSLSPFPSMT